MTNILYVQTTGTEKPERQYAPLILAQTAKAMGIDASIFFLGLGVTTIKKGGADNIKLGTFPSLKDVLNESIKNGVKIYVCEQSTQLINLSRGDFIPEAEIAGAGTLNDLVLDADATMWF